MLDRKSYVNYIVGSDDNELDRLLLLYMEELNSILVIDKNEYGDLMFRLNMLNIEMKYRKKSKSYEKYGKK